MSPKTMIITGASRGLGAAMARVAGESGVQVVLNARSEDDLLTVVREIRGRGGRAIAIAGDVSDSEFCQRAVEQALESFGGIDAVINNAGVIEPIAPVAHCDPQAWEQSWKINVLGAVQMTQAALPHLRARAGRVVNVSSGAAARPVGGWGAYCSSKAALNQFTAVLAAEEEEIVALAVAPGAVDTAMQTAIRSGGREGMAEQEYARFVRLIEQGELLPAEMPGRTLIALALHAPREWSGSFVSWDSQEVQALVERRWPGQR